MDKRLEIEGSPYSKFVQAMRQHGYNSDINIEVGTVTSSNPIRISLDNEAIELDSDDLVIAESLTEHTRKGRVNGGDIVDIEFESSLEKGARVILASVDDGQLYYVLDKAVE